VVVLVGTWEEVGVLKKIGCQWFIDMDDGFGKYTARFLETNYQTPFFFFVCVCVCAFEVTKIYSKIIVVNDLFVFTKI
jgi:hypothetical protein